MDQAFKADFLAASKKFDENDLNVDLSGKSFMLTGANTGIGKSVTMELAKRGGTVHMLCQYADEETRKEVVEKTGNKNIHLHVLELSKPRDVYEFATKFAENWKELHVLVNNAAGLVWKKEMTDYGLDKNFAINTMAPYLLTKTLLPTINMTPGSRVIIVSTVGVYPEKLNLSDLNNDKMETYDGHDCYARSKNKVGGYRKGFARRLTIIRADRSVIPMHQPGLDTDSTLEEKQQLMRTLEKLADDVRKDV